MGGIKTLRPRTKEPAPRTALHPCGRTKAMAIERPAGQRYEHRCDLPGYRSLQVTGRAMTRKAATLSGTVILEERFGADLDNNHLARGIDVDVLPQTPMARKSPCGSFRSHPW